MGPATSTDVVATDLLPAGLTLESATTSIGTYSSSTGIWAVGDMSVGSTAALTVVAQVQPAAPGTRIANTATVTESASSTDNNLANNSSTAMIQICGCGGGGGGGGSHTSSTLTVSVSGLVASDTASIAVNDITAGNAQSTSTGNGSVPFVIPTNDHYAVTATTTNPNYSVATSTGCAGTL